MGASIEYQKVEDKIMAVTIKATAPKDYSERHRKVVIARSETTCLRAEALRRASVAI
jgi:hypothetical protein